MELLVGIGIILSFLASLIFLFLSIFVLQAYEEQTKNRPPAFQYWPFNREMQTYFPTASRIGKALEITIFVGAAPWLVQALFSA